MKWIAQKIKRERTELKIYKKAKAEFDRKLAFKTQEIKSEALTELSDIKSELRAVKADHKKEISQTQTECRIKSARLDKELAKYENINSELESRLMRINNIGGVLQATFEKILHNRLQERKQDADLMDDIKTIQNLMHDAQQISRGKQ